MEMARTGFLGLKTQSGRGQPSAVNGRNPAGGSFEVYWRTACPKFQNRWYGAFQSAGPWQGASSMSSTIAPQVSSSVAVAPTDGAPSIPTPAGRHFHNLRRNVL